MPSKAFVYSVAILCPITFMLNALEMVKALNEGRMGSGMMWTIATVTWLFAMSGAFRLWFLYKDHNL